MGNDLNLNFDNDKKINLDGDNSPSSLNIKKNEELTGVELLANNKIKVPELNVSGGNISDIGYSSGEDSNKSTKKEDYDFFNDMNMNDSQINSQINEVKDTSKKINIPIDDPVINNMKGAESGEFKPVHTMNGQDIKNEKIDLIYKFKRLESQGIRTTMNYNMNSQLEDMRNEYLKLKKQREIENSIKFQRKVMMAMITGMEFLNNKFDPFDVKLDGWSESVNENINDFDEVFEELAEKYGGKSEIAPELKLLMMLGGSAFMFHLTNTMFKTSIPGMDDIMKQNPDLMKQFAQAAVGSLNKTTNEPTQLRTDIPLPSSMSPPPMNPSSMNHPSMNQNNFQRQEMSGPNSLDDIINQINIDQKIPDLDTISLLSNDSDKKSNTSGGITLNL